MVRKYRYVGYLPPWPHLPPAKKMLPIQVVSVQKIYFGGILSQTDAQNWNLKMHNGVKVTLKKQCHEAALFHGPAHHMCHEGKWLKRPILEHLTLNKKNIFLNVNFYRPRNFLSNTLQPLPMLVSQEVETNCSLKSKLYRYTAVWPMKMSWPS
jgi:hypothetical protein